VQNFPLDRMAAERHRLGAMIDAGVESHASIYAAADSRLIEQRAQLRWRHIRRFERPEYIARRDGAPIVCLPGDGLLRHHPVDLPYKDGRPPSALVSSSENFEDTA
jgi:hypothetical protein